jgi:hypothetical protein
LDQLQGTPCDQCAKGFFAWTGECGGTHGCKGEDCSKCTINDANSVDELQVISLSLPDEEFCNEINDAIDALLKE